jgi:ABC-2 type transport system permease protein
VKALAIAGANLRRTLRERSNVFFIFLFPLLMIFAIGAAFGGSGEPRIGLAVADPGPLAARLVAGLTDADGVEVHRAGSAGELTAAVERGEYEVGVSIPAGYDGAVAAGRPVAVALVARPGLTSQQVSSIVRSVVQRESGQLRAARFAAAERGLPFDAALARADGISAQLPALEVSGRAVGVAPAAPDEGRFDGSASTQLLLFLFVTALTSAVALVETRRLGLSRRMLTTPTPARVIIFGEALGRVAISGLQGLFVMLVSALVFGVNWGDPLAAGALMAAFALAASGAGMLLGAYARTPQLAVAVGLLVGLGLAALGGAMMPLEFFSPTLRTIAHVVTPHAWAVDAFTVLLRDGGGIADILPQLGVLLGAAGVLLGLASWRLRRAATT